jgi:hypothetical protein
MLSTRIIPNDKTKTRHRIVHGKLDQVDCIGQRHRIRLIALPTSNWIRLIVLSTDNWSRSVIFSTDNWTGLITLSRHNWNRSVVFSTDKWIGLITLSTQLEQVGRIVHRQLDRANRIVHTQLEQVGRIFHRQLYQDNHLSRGNWIRRIEISTDNRNGLITLTMLCHPPPECASISLFT